MLAGWVWISHWPSTSLFPHLQNGDNNSWTDVCESTGSLNIGRICGTCGRHWSTLDRECTLREKCFMVIILGSGPADVQREGAREAHCETVGRGSTGLFPLARVGYWEPRPLPHGPHCPVPKKKFLAPPRPVSCKINYPCPFSPGRCWELMTSSTNYLVPPAESRCMAIRGWLISSLNLLVSFAKMMIYYLDNLYIYISKGL